MYWQDWPLFYAVGYLFSSLFDPVLWTLALCGVLLGRKLRWPAWTTVLSGGVFAALGSVFLIAIARPEWAMNVLRMGVTLAVSLLVAGVILLILRTFARPKAS